MDFPVFFVFFHDLGLHILIWVWSDFCIYITDFLIQDTDFNNMEAFVEWVVEVCTLLNIFSSFNVINVITSWFINTVILQGWSILYKNICCMSVYSGIRSLKGTCSWSAQCQKVICYKDCKAWSRHTERMRGCGCWWMMVTLGTVTRICALSFIRSRVVLKEKHCAVLLNDSFNHLSASLSLA